MLYYIEVCLYDKINKEYSSSSAIIWPITFNDVDDVTGVSINKGCWVWYGKFGEQLMRKLV